MPYNFSINLLNYFLKSLRKTEVCLANAELVIFFGTKLPFIKTLQGGGSSRSSFLIAKIELFPYCPYLINVRHPKRGFLFFYFHNMTPPVSVELNIPDAYELSVNKP